MTLNLTKSFLTIVKAVDDNLLLYCEIMIPKIYLVNTVDVITVFLIIIIS